MAAMTSRSPQEFADQGGAALVNTVAGGVTGGIQGAAINKGATSGKSTASKSSGKPYVKGQRSGAGQIGVDPNTLKLGRSLNPDKVEAVELKISREGMYGHIDVTSKGVVYDGNHRVDYAQRHGVAVDTVVVFYDGGD